MLEKEKNKIFKNIVNILPPIKKIRLYSEADYYGASSLIAQKLKLPFRLFSYIGWKHGWLYADLKYIEQLTGGSNYKNYLVANKSDEEFLKLNNIKAKAVGMPFVYVKDIEKQTIYRYKNTLLVMPPHSLPYTMHEWFEEKYAKEISELSSQFDLIVVCIHKSCIDKGMWVESFKKYDIPFIQGADVHDKNALKRMYRLFSSFEYMTTNTIGSHIPFAAFSGCKVSIYGDYMEYNIKDFNNDKGYEKMPYLYEHNLKYGSAKYVEKLFSEFFVNPKLAIKKKSWANQQLGEVNKVSFFLLAKYLGWMPHIQLLNVIKKVSSKIYNKIV